jgi:hypothetical protein
MFRLGTATTRATHPPESACETEEANSSHFIFPEDYLDRESNFVTELYRLSISPR